MPQSLTYAILAAEDERFYQHSGVDYVGVARAALSNFASGEVRQGASTITMQVARNFFLTKEKTITRKFNEVLLAFKIESNLSKDQILELYINQIYLGQRAYGFGAAAQTYFGKPLGALTLAESAMLAGILKAPSRFNPIADPDVAERRTRQVLANMVDAGFIDAGTAAQAKPTAKRPSAVAASLPYGRYFADWVMDQVQGFVGFTDRDLTVDLSVFSSDVVRLRWLDPSDGTYRDVGSLPTSDAVVVVHPGDNAGDDPDWVLVVDEAPTVADSVPTVSS